MEHAQNIREHHTLRPRSISQQTGLKTGQVRTPLTMHECRAQGPTQCQDGYCAARLDDRADDCSRQHMRRDMRKAVLWAPTAEDKDSIIDTLVGLDGIETAVGKNEGRNTERDAGETISKGRITGKCPEEMETMDQRSEAMTPSNHSNA